MDQTKICDRCHTEYPISEFPKGYSHVQKKWDIVDDCKKCRKERRSEYQRNYQKNYVLTDEQKSKRKKTHDKYMSKPESKEKAKNRYNVKKLNNIHLWWAIWTLKRHLKKGHAFEISPEQLASLAKNTHVCPMCGCTFTWGHSGYNRCNPTLDRVNNDTGKITSFQIICYSCNTTKGDKTMIELKEWCKKVIEYCSTMPSLHVKPQQ